MMWDRHRVWSEREADAFSDEWAEHGGLVEQGRDVDYWWDCIAPKVPHPGLHSPEVMTEDPTTEPCPTCRTWGNGNCDICAGLSIIKAPGRTFVAWHTLGATIPEGWEVFDAFDSWVIPDRDDPIDAGQPYLVREPLTPPDPPQDERGWICGATLQEGECSPERPDHSILTCGWRFPRHVLPAEPVRVGAAEAQPPPQLPGPSGYERVEPPSGVQVIGWTEPTDDEPRSLPIVRGRDAVIDGWERQWMDEWATAPQHADDWYTDPDPSPGAAYMIRPVPVPPAPETEASPARETERVTIEVPVEWARRQGKAAADPSPMWTDDYIAVVDACAAAVLPLDGTDGD
jgi:hypothetical protein